jgi:hypothetical protein
MDNAQRAGAAASSFCDKAAHARELPFLDFRSDRGVTQTAIGALIVGCAT